MTFKWILSRMYIIMVGAGGGGETGMHVICYRENIPYRYISWENSIQAINHLVAGNGKKFLFADMSFSSSEDNAA